MQPGRLRSKVTLQSRVLTPDAVNDQVATYVDLADEWASIEPIVGREFFAAQQVQADVTTRIRIRYRVDAVPTMRVKFVADYDSPQQIDYYDVEAVMHTNEKRRETILMCRKRYADGFRDG